MSNWRGHPFKSVVVVLMFIWILKKVYALLKEYLDKKEKKNISTAAEVKHQEPREVIREIIREPQIIREPITRNRNPNMEYEYNDGYIACGNKRNNDNKSNNFTLIMFLVMVLWASILGYIGLKGILGY